MPVVVRAEEPVLSLPRVAMCLHFVEESAFIPLKDALAYPECPVMRSMELDLLSYRFQLEPPFGSRCESHGGTAVRLLFPDALRYQSEGREVTLVCPSPCREAAVLVTSTRFLRSGLRLWHVVITPAPGTQFSEFELIKLIQLYDGRTEATRLAEELWFEIPGGRRVRAGELLPAVWPSAPPSVSLRAGTLQIAAGDEVAGGRTLAQLVEAACDPESDEAEEWLEGATPEGRALQACCGVVSGIFDFDHLDAAEASDVLEPTVPEYGGLVRFHRCTLTAITEGDRAMEACAERVGISPYLIIPHAALLHNEALVDAADQALESVLSDPRARLGRLEGAHARADLLLNRLYLPNVFNYRSERELFRRGAEERGSEERRTSALAKLAELNSRIGRAWEQRREGGQMCIAVLLALISVLQLKDLVFTMVGSGPGGPVGWAVLGAAGAVLAVLIVVLWRLGVRRST